MSPKSTRNLETPSGSSIVLSPDEYRLALLGLADFEGHWDIMQVAATMVVDGKAKAALLREKLMPVVDSLPGLLADGMDVFQLWTARQWFASQACHSTPVTEGTGDTIATGQRDPGTQQEDT